MSEKITERIKEIRDLINEESEFDYTLLSWNDIARTKINNLQKIDTKLTDLLEEMNNVFSKF